ncbi:MAG: AsmA family protein [Bacteroidales bacterium]|nr:AsmA family protein [Bacteroidales bacterium]
MKKFLKILLISLGSIVGLFTIVFSIVCFILFTPSQLTPLVNRFANDFLNANVKIERVDLSYFSVYPFVRLNIENILILDENNPDDTLIFIPSARAKLNFNAFVFRNNLIINELELRGGVTNVIFSEDGTMNWDIFPMSDVKTETAPMGLDSMFNMVDIKSIALNSGRINYRNEKNGQIVAIQNANLHLNGSFLEQHLLSEMFIDLQNIDYSDSTIGVRLSRFQTTLTGDLLNSHVNAVSEIVLDSLHYNTETMRVFFPQMTISLESTTDFNDGKIHMQTIIEQIHFVSEHEVLLDNANLNLTLVAEYFSENQKISIEKGAFYINEIPFQLAGTVEMKDPGFYTNLSFNLDTTRFSQIYELLPKAIADMIVQYAQINDGQVFCHGTIFGKFANGTMPDIDLTFGLRHMDMVVYNSQIDTLNLVSDVRLRLNDLQNSRLTVRDFFYSGHLGTASATAIVNGFTNNPHIETHLVTDLNLRRLYRMLMNGSAFRTRGTIHANLNADFALQDALNFSLEKFERIRVDGVVEIDDLLVRNRPDSLNLFADLVRLRFGSQVEDERLDGHALFRASVRLDSLDFVYRNLYTANVARFSTSYRVEMPNPYGFVNTQSARISFRGINVRMPQERIRLTAGRTSANVRIVPNPDKPTSPVGNIRASIDELFFRQPGTATVRLGSSQLNLALMPQNPVVRAGSGRGRDTLAVTNGISVEERRRGRDTTLTDQERQQRRLERLAEMSSDQFIEKLLGYLTILGDTNIDVAQKFMSEFSYEGSLVFDTFRLRIPDFPLPISVLSTEVNLNPRLLSLDNATVIMGNTDMVISGGLENFRRALAGRGTLRGHVDLTSNKIDANQLMLAMRNDPALRDTTQRRGRGGEGGGRRRDAEQELSRFELMDREREERRAERAASGEGGGRRGERERGNITETQVELEADPDFMVVSDSLLKAEASEDHSEFDVVFEAPPKASLFMIPRLLNLTLNADIDTLLLGYGVMTNLHGEAEVRDEFLRLNEFRLTNRAGGMNIALAYRAHSLSDATVWMDMSIENTEIQALIDLYPDIQEDMPIMQSLKGLVDLHLTLSSHLDSAMNVDLNRTVASASMRGQDLVLLDDENFSRIARMLGFRSRDQNLIDSMSVNATVDNGVIEIFPFKLTMNRYSLAVGGTQNLDMSFHYHITILESPFRLFRPISWGTALMSGVGLGVDVLVAPKERLRIRPTGANFRDLATPATSMNVERTINVQQEFRRLLEHELDQITGQSTENGDSNETPLDDSQTPNENNQ